MQLTIARKELAKALGQVGRIVDKNSTIPILGNFLLDAGAGKLAITATDLDILARTEVPAAVGLPGKLTVPAGMLGDIARKLPEGAEIALTAERGQLVVKSGRSRFSLQTLPPEDYPDMPEGEPSHRFAIEPKALLRLFERTAFAISAEETRYYLNGVFLHTLSVDGAEVLRAVATDGHRLARIEMPAPEGAAGMPGIIVPRKTVDALSRLLKAAEGPASIALSPTKIVAEIGATKIVSKLIDGSFPDYGRVVPVANDKRAVLDREIFAAAADRVATISSERGRAVRLAFGDGALTLSVQNPDAGSATEEIEADYDGPAIDIGFNSKYLAEVLAVIGGDTVAVEMENSGAPTLFRPTADKTYLVVVMPLRI